MKKQIVHISVHQTSKVIAAMHAVMFTVLFILPSVFGYWYQGEFIFGIILLILVPLILWALMYIGYVVACWFYNLVTPLTGGIEVEVVDSNGPSDYRAKKIVTPDEEVMIHPKENPSSLSKDDKLL